MQPKRTETLGRFKNNEIRLPVCSDVAARGLDIAGLSHVFCFDVPYHAEDYVHRIGRTGRAGLPGRSFMLAAPEDGNNVAAITRLIGRDIPPVSIERHRPGRPSSTRAKTPAAAVAVPAPARARRPPRPVSAEGSKAEARTERGARTAGRAYEGSGARAEAQRSSAPN